MYVNVVEEMDEFFSIIFLVFNVIVEMYGGFFGKKAVLIFEMLRCFFSKIWFLLDILCIRQDDTYNVVEMDIYLELGIFILIEDYYLFNEVFVEFEF